MKADLDNHLVRRYFEIGLAHIERNQVKPTPTTSYRNEFRCAFTDEVFISTRLDASNILMFINIRMREVDVISVAPDVLRRIREYLRYEGEYVVLHDDLMTKAQFGTWDWMVRQVYTIRTLRYDSSHIFDMREWRGAVKIALTNDWSGEAVEQLENGELDVNFMADTLTYIFNIQIEPIQLHYIILSSKLQSGSWMYGVYITPSRKTFDNYYYSTFVDRYARYAESATILEEGLLTFDTVNDMYENLTSALTQINTSVIENGRVDMTVNLGLRQFYTSGHECNRFLMRWEH